MTASAISPGELLRGRYRIVGTLGAGGVATVYDALDVTIQRPVAIKVLLPDHRAHVDVCQRLLREGYVGALLGHPFICGVSDIGTLTDGSPFLVMERLRGRTVAERLDTTGPLSLSSAVTFTEQLLSALSAAHAQGVIHRDVKPANVFMVAVNGLPPIAKLLDFGTALCRSDLLPAGMNDIPLQTQLTAVGKVIGTPYYLAPEQAAGLRDLDARVDVYQAGVFLYEALSGKRPTDGASYADLVSNIANGYMTPIERVVPNLPPPLSLVIMRALRATREDRFQTADEMLEALTATRHERGTMGDWEPTTQVDMTHRGEPMLDPTTTAPMMPRDRLR